MQSKLVENKSQSTISSPAAAALCDLLSIRCSQAPDLNSGGLKNQEKISQFSAHTHQLTNNRREFCTKKLFKFVLFSWS